MNRAGAVIIEVCIAGILLLLLIPRIPELAQWAYRYPQTRLVLLGRANQLLKERVEQLALLRESTAEIERQLAAIKASEAKEKLAEAAAAKRARIKLANELKPPKVGIRCSDSVTTDCYDEQNVFRAKTEAH